jgi:hypothetical protein
MGAVGKNSVVGNISVRVKVKVKVKFKLKVQVKIKLASQAPSLPGG